MKTSFLCRVVSAGSMFALPLMIALFSTPAGASPIAQWVFSDANTSHLPGFWAFGSSQTILPEVGSGTMTATTGTGGTPSSGPSSTMSLSSNSDLTTPDDGTSSIVAGSGANRSGNHFSMEVDTTLYSDISLMLDVTGSNNRLWFVAYSIDGGSNFVNTGDVFIPQGGFWSRLAFDLSALNQIEGVSNLILRVGQFGAASGHAARFDNFTISGTVTVPEPSTHALVSLALVALAGRRRQRARQHLPCRGAPIAA